MKLAIVSGTSIARSEIASEWDEFNVNTDYGVTAVKKRGNLVLINRHGFEEALPPHAINYRGYVSAMRELEVDSVLTFSSVGSLKADLTPGSFVSCSDYVSFSPKTFIDHRMSGFTPDIDNGLMKELKGIVSEDILTHRIYAQTPGPRFETRAEVRILQAWGCDVVGMTFANEADLILESGMSLTSLCVVDNFAHGVVDEKLTLEHFRQGVARNQKKVNLAFRKIVNYWK